MAKHAGFDSAAPDIGHLPAFIQPCSRTKKRQVLAGAGGTGAGAPREQKGCGRRSSKRRPVWSGQLAPAPLYSSSIGRFLPISSAGNTDNSSPVW